MSPGQKTTKCTGSHENTQQGNVHTQDGSPQRNTLDMKDEKDSQGWEERKGMEQKTISGWDFPGGPAAKTAFPRQREGRGSIPGWGTGFHRPHDSTEKIPHATNNT